MTSIIKSNYLNNLKIYSREYSIRTILYKNLSMLLKKVIETKVQKVPLGAYKI